MKRVLGVCCLLLILAALASCRSSSKHGPEGSQERFGVTMAKMNLWREALFRFKRAVEISPADAQAHNNLAVAYEANGDFEAAAKEYREAMRLDKSNQYIQKNYSRLIEFQSRNKKRQRPQTTAKPAATEAAAAPAAGTEAGTATAPAPPTSTAEPPTQVPPVTTEGTPAPGATPAAAPAVVPPTTPPATPPPAPATPPPSAPVKSGGQR